jgi:hypothetical protein
LRHRVCRPTHCRDSHQIAGHQASLEKLKREQPEFYAFMAENDPVNPTSNLPASLATHPPPYTHTPHPIRKSSPTRHP